MIKFNKMRFNLYRFQIIPKDRKFQPNLFDDINSIEKLIENKNKIFFKILENISSFITKRIKIKSVVLFKSNDFIIYKFAPQKFITVETKDFDTKDIEDWPSFHVLIWNNPTKQIIAIEERSKAFQKTKTVNNIIMNTVNQLLEPKNLVTYSEPLFRKENFWNIIQSHRNNVIDVRFDLVTPNMANISDVLSEDLKSLAKMTNTAKTKISISSDKNSSLTIEEDNTNINSLVEYASEGGGNISVKIKGIKKRKQTSENLESIEINEVEFNSNSAEMIKEIIDGFIK